MRGESEGRVVEDGQQRVRWPESCDCGRVRSGGGGLADGEEVARGIATVSVQ